MLDIVQAALSAEPITFLRIDGDVASGAQRQSLVERFQARRRHGRVMCMRMRVVALRATHASRVPRRRTPRFPSCS